MGVAQDQRPPGEYQVHIVVVVDVHHQGALAPHDEARCAAYALERPHRTADAARHDVLGLCEKRRRTRCLRKSHQGALHDADSDSLSHPATSAAWYVMIASAPALRMPVSASSTARRSSIQPRWAAALSMAYSPLTLYATRGSRVRSRTARITSRYASAGFTMRKSAPSASSSPASSTASRTFAGSI